MDFLANDLSLSGQFHNLALFVAAVARMMELRQEIRRYGSALYCHRKMAYARVTPDMVMQQAIQHLQSEQRRALMQWLTQNGPYWEDAQLHAPDDWLEANGDIVTDSAVGEAAFCRIHGLSRELVSFWPSQWNFNPVQASWVRDGRETVNVDIPNHWEAASVRLCLETNPERAHSWAELGAQIRRACTRLTFADNAFLPLEGHPFAPGAAGRIRVLLWTLNKFKGCFDDQGNRNAEGHQLYADHFTGARAWFSDSSDGEKNAFREKLTFPHPHRQGEFLFCSWHGKVKTPQIRIHFSWPIRSDEPLYVVYVGPKLTKR